MDDQRWSSAADSPTILQITERSYFPGRGPGRGPYVDFQIGIVPADGTRAAKEAAATSVHRRFEQLSGESPLTVAYMWAAGIKTQWGAERLIRGRECRGGSRTIRLQPPTLRRGWRSSRIASSPQANRFGLEADPSSGPAWASAPAHRTARGRSTPPRSGLARGHMLRAHADGQLGVV
jgi:hypothetical protein